MVGVLGAKVTALPLTGFHDGSLYTPVFQLQKSLYGQACLPVSSGRLDHRA